MHHNVQALRPLQIDYLFDGFTREVKFEWEYDLYTCTFVSTSVCSGLQNSNTRIVHDESVI